MAESLKTKTLRGSLWSVVERFSAQGVSFVVMIIMTRLLTPRDYGLVGMLLIFTEIAVALVDSGFSQALIRKQDRNETDNSTVFYFNIGVAALIYIILFFSAPAIANFYDEPMLVPLTRWISLGIVINAFAVVQRALLTVNIDFRTQAKASVTSAIIGGAVGIYMAWTGYGVWSIVAFQLTHYLLHVGLLWIWSKWRPRLLYSWNSFRLLFGFGSKLAVAAVVDTLYRNIYTLVIGKVFRPTDLGYYTRANQFANFLSSNVASILQRVTYPVLCSIQDNDTRLESAYRRVLRFSAFIIFPFMTGLAAVSHPFIIVLLKKQWAFAAVLMQILCIALMLYPVHSLNLNLLQVKGRSDLFLKLEFIKKAVGIAIIACTLPFGLVALCVGQVLNSVIALFINTHYTGKLINVGLLSQLHDLLPAFFYSFSMWGVMALVQFPLEADWLKLTVAVPVGVIWYVGIAKICRSQELSEVVAIIKRKK